MTNQEARMATLYSKKKIKWKPKPGGEVKTIYVYMEGDKNTVGKLPYMLKEKENFSLPVPK